jgi:chromatin modification-related protein YNG2
MTLYGSELQQEIDKDSAKYIRHSLQASSASTSPPSPSSPALSPKTAIPVKISASYAEIQELSTEKCALAQQLIELLSKTRARLDIDIVKVKMLQGESPDTPTVASRSSARPLAATSTLENFSAIGRNPALAISESLRNAFALTSAADSPPVTPAALSGPATKSTFHLYPFSSLK